MEEEEEGSMCNKATKSTARKASMPCEGKGTRKGKGAEKSGRRRGGVHG